MPPKFKKQFVAQNPKHFASINELKEQNPSFDSDAFYWTASNEIVRDFYCEQNEQLDFVKDNSSEAIAALVDDFKNKYGITLDEKQIRYYMTKEEAITKQDYLKHKKEIEKSKREELEEKFQLQQAESLKSGIEKKPWEFDIDNELDNLKLQPTSNNYQDMYFGLLESATNQLYENMKDSSVEERKAALNNMLYDFGETCMGIYAACGGFRVNDYIPNVNSDSRITGVPYYNTVLGNPLFGNVAEGSFNKMVSSVLPADFLRDKSEEVNIDLLSIGKDKNKTFSLGEMNYIANEYDSAQKQYDSHWDITKFFSTLKIFKNIPFFKKINQEGAKLRNMERIAKSFAPERNYKNEAAKLNAGKALLQGFIDKKKNNQIIDVTTNLREKATEKGLNVVDASVAMVGFANIAGMERFRSISLAGLKHDLPLIVSRTYGSIALKKIANVTDTPELDVDNNPDSCSKAYGKISDKTATGLLIKMKKLSGDVKTDDNGNTTYEINSDGKGTYEYWMQQIHHGIYDNGISLGSAKTSKEINVDLEKDLKEINENFKANIAKGSIEFEKEELEEEKPSKGIKIKKDDNVNQLDGSSTNDFSGISQEKAQKCLNAMDVNIYVQEINQLNHEEEKVMKITVEDAADDFTNNKDFSEKEEGPNLNLDENLIK